MRIRFRAALVGSWTLAGALAAGGAVVSGAAAVATDLNLRHAYYLFLRSPTSGCEDCYIPLLMTPVPLEDIAAQQDTTVCVVITTYERDSIVGTQRQAVVPAADVQPGERYIRLGERQYRYHEVGAEEVCRLLERPEGTIPIHRAVDMAYPSREALQALAVDFCRVPRRE